MFLFNQVLREQPTCLPPLGDFGCTDLPWVCLNLSQIHWNQICRNGIMIMLQKVLVLASLIICSRITCMPTTSRGEKIVASFFFLLLDLLFIRSFHQPQRALEREDRDSLNIKPVNPQHPFLTV